MSDFFSQLGLESENTPAKAKKPLRRRASGGNGGTEGYAPQTAAQAPPPPQGGGGTRPLRRVSASERLQKSRAAKGEMRTFKALLVTMDAFVGYDSKKKVTNISADSVDGLATALEERLLDDYEMDVPAESFSIQYFDSDFDHFVDLDSLEHLAAVGKLTLVPRDNVIPSRLLDDDSVPNAMPAPVANAEIVPGSKGKKYGAAEEDKPLQSMKQRPQRLSSGGSKADAGGAGRFNYNRFKMDLLVGIPFVKRSAKDAKSASRVLYIDPKFEFLNWRAPSSKSEKDHFDMFRVRPVFSKKKEALPIASLQNVKAARSPKGLYFVRLVFSSRNLDMEAADAFTFEELSRGLTMLMNEAKGQTEGNRQTVVRSESLAHIGDADRVAVRDGMEVTVPGTEVEVEVAMRSGLKEEEEEMEFRGGAESPP